MSIIIGEGSGNAISVNSTVGTAGSVITSDGTNSYWAPKGISNVTLQIYTGSGTWTKPSTADVIKVTVVGAGGSGTGGAGSNLGDGGGGGGTAIRYIQAPAIPGPVAVTAGQGTNSFGTFVSATSGSTGGASVSSGAGGVGINGDINIGGGDGRYKGPGSPSTIGGGGGGTEGRNYGGGGSGGNLGGGGGNAGGAGAPGIVIVEVYS